MNMFTDAARKRAQQLAERRQADRIKQEQNEQHAGVVASDLNQFLNNGDSPYAGKFELAQNGDEVSISHKSSKDSMQIKVLGPNVYAVTCDSASLAPDSNKAQMSEIVIDWLGGNIGRDGAP